MVHQDARRERIFGRRDPARERRATSRARGRVGRDLARSVGGGERRLEVRFRLGERLLGLVELLFLGGLVRLVERLLGDELGPGSLEEGKLSLRRERGLRGLLPCVVLLLLQAFRLERRPERRAARLRYRHVEAGGRFRLGHGLQRALHGLVFRGQRQRPDEFPPLGRGGRRRQRDGFDLQGRPAQRARHGGGDHFRGVRVPVVAPLEAVGRRLGLRVVGARQADLRHVELAARDMVRADVMRLEEGAEGVILLLRNRIEEVVVAARAIHRRREECLRGVLDRLLEPGIAAEAVPVAHEEARGPQGLGVLRGDLVAREHLDDHAVVGLVRVEALDDPIAPAPDVRLAVAHLCFPAVPVAVAPDVHEVTPPALAVAWVGQQAVDDLLVRIGGRIGQEGLQFLEGGREADQVDGHAPQERRPRRLRARRDAPRALGGGQEGVHGMAAVGRRPEGGLDRRPMGRDGVLAGLRIGPRGALVDPAAEDLDLLGGEARRLLGHPGVVIGVDEQLIEEALASLPRKDGLPGHAALERRRAHVEPELSLLLRGGVARDAMLAEDGAHVAREVDRRAVALGLRGCPEQQRERGHSPTTHGWTSLNSVCYYATLLSMV